MIIILKLIRVKFMKIDRFKMIFLQRKIKFSKYKNTVTLMSFRLFKRWMIIIYSKLKRNLNLVTLSRNLILSLPIKISLMINCFNKWMIKVFLCLINQNISQREEESRFNKGITIIWSKILHLYLLPENIKGEVLRMRWELKMKTWPSSSLTIHNLWHVRHWTLIKFKFLLSN